MIKDFIEIIRLRLHDIKLIDVDESVYDKFRKYVKGHSNDPDLEIRKRLTRNYILSKDTEIIKPIQNTMMYVSTRFYGNLIIKCRVDTTGETIVNIYNRKGKKQDFKIDKELKEELNRKMRL